MKIFFIFCFASLFATAASAKIVFYSKRDGNAEIYVMNDNGSHVRRVTDNLALEILPLWAPDGRNIAFRRIRAQNAQGSTVVLMAADGSDERNLTHNDETVHTPAFFTPDGRELAIVRWEANVWRLSFLDLSRGVTRQLRGVEDITGADLSPNERFIVFAKADGFAKNIHIVDANGLGEEKALLPPEAEPNLLLIRAYPRWAPDSQRVIFSEERLDIVEKEDEEGVFIDFVVRESKLLIHHKALKKTEPVPLPQGFRPTSPCWINNNELLFSADATGLITKAHGNYDIYHYNLTSGKRTQLTTHPAPDMAPHWVAGTLEVSVGKKVTRWSKVKVAK